MSDDRIKELYRAYFKSVLDQHKRWYNHPAYVAYREQRDREWRALPFYVKAWRRIRGKFSTFRVRLGEIIAGREFE
jgi:hypothetical protein